MKTRRFSESQVIAILKQGDSGIKVKDLCREHGISDATYYNWKAKYGGLEASDLKRLKETESELSKLKRMKADLALENRALKDLLEKKLSRRLRNGRRSRPCGRLTAFQWFGVVMRFASHVQPSTEHQLSGKSGRRTSLRHSMPWLRPIRAGGCGNTYSAYGLLGIPGITNGFIGCIDS